MGSLLFEMLLCPLYDANEQELFIDKEKLPANFVGWILQNNDKDNSDGEVFGEYDYR